MPQTIEAINHARAAEVPIVVAITKADKSLGAGPHDKVKQQLSQHGDPRDGLGRRRLGLRGLRVPPARACRAARSTWRCWPRWMPSAAAPTPRATADGRGRRGREQPRPRHARHAAGRPGHAPQRATPCGGRPFGPVRAMVDDRGHTIDELPPGAPAEVIGLDRASRRGQQFFASPTARRPRRSSPTGACASASASSAAQTKPATVESLLSPIDQDEGARPERRAQGRREGLARAAQAVLTRSATKR